jgi:hypothetical protein
MQRAIRKMKIVAIALVVASSFSVLLPATALAAPHACGGTKDKYTPSIELGCTGKGEPIMDLLFAFVRFLSYGAGLIIVGSLTYAGIQYTGSRGDPNATALAVKRLQANVVALLLFVFAFAIINYVVPGQVLK